MLILLSYALLNELSSDILYYERLDFYNMCEFIYKWWITQIMNDT